MTCFNLRPLVEIRNVTLCHERISCSFFPKLKQSVTVGHVTWRSLSQSRHLHVFCTSEAHDHHHQNVDEKKLQMCETQFKQLPVRSPLRPFAPDVWWVLKMESISCLNKSFNVCLNNSLSVWTLHVSEVFVCVHRITSICLLKSE